MSGISFLFPPFLLPTQFLSRTVIFIVEGGKDVRGEGGHLQNLLMWRTQYFCLETRGC